MTAGHVTAGSTFGRVGSFKANAAKMTEGNAANRSHMSYVGTNGVHFIG